MPRKCKQGITCINNSTIFVLLLCALGVYMFYKKTSQQSQSSEKVTFVRINDNVSSIIKKSIQIKGEIVTVDENEKYGSRIMLNYGHTLGLAIESSTNLEQYTHGEAVSIGMSFAAKLSNHLNMLSDDDLKLHNDILKKFDQSVFIKST